jgi:hypothetical protein
MENPSMAAAEFFDKDRRSRGAARTVTLRGAALSGLTSLDVTGADGTLAAFLTNLDKSRLVVHHVATGARWLTFRWASGYANGDDIRVQGLLEGARGTD